MICRYALWVFTVVGFLGVGTKAFDLPLKTTQLPDGQIIFPWPEGQGGPDNSYAWKYKPTRWGSYYVEAIFKENTPATDIRVEVAGQTVSKAGVPNEILDQFRILRIDRTYIAESKPFTVQASSKNIENLQGILLRPAPEGGAIVQNEEGIVLHAGAATTHSVMMRYEPATNKNCLGYWTNPSDTAEWKFNVTKPGTYEVEIWQGCGKGQGGSTVSIEIFGPGSLLSYLKQARFVVEDTGHFQNFIPRGLGQATFREAGEYTFVVEPKSKKAAAVMDVRQIILRPASLRQIVRNPSLESLLVNERVIFLGDSITYSGEYIEYLETFLRLRYPANDIDFINLGLPSETVSGLSEPGHAGGEFPRPSLEERLERVLEKAKPQVIFACYGMNDGIYHPYTEERFRKFENGLNQLRIKAGRHVQVVHLTPPTFDPSPLKGRTRPWGAEKYDLPYEAYNEVLDRYSDWIVRQRSEGPELPLGDFRPWEVIDIHTPMNRFLAEQRKTNPNFVLARDGVHPNAQGQWLIAREILRYIGAPEEVVSAGSADALLKLSPQASKVLELVQKRQRVLKDAWLTHVGHKRPGMNKGKPIEEAQREAAEINEKLKHHERAESKKSAAE
jgi:lysophospholipase L1-like esterase